MRREQELNTQEIIDKIESRLRLAESARNPAHRQEYLALANAYSAYLLARNTCSVAELVEPDTGYDSARGYFDYEGNR